MYSIDIQRYMLKTNTYKIYTERTNDHIHTYMSSLYILVYHVYIIVCTVLHKNIQ